MPGTEALGGDQPELTLEDAGRENPADLRNQIRRWIGGQMNDETKANLAASLNTAMTELSDVVRHVRDLVTDKEIEQHAEILDHIADTARGGADILRAVLTAHRRSRPPLPRRVRRDATNAHQVPGGRAGDTS